MLSSQSWNEFPPHHLNTSLSIHCYWMSIIIFKPVWSYYAIVPHGTPHCNLLHTQWSKHMFMRLDLGPKVHVRFVNLSAKVKACFITKENQVQKVRMVFNSLTDALTKCKPVCLICSSLSLQNLYFVWKHVKVLVHYPHNGCTGQISLLRQTFCGFPWFYCQIFSLSMLGSVLADLSHSLWPLFLSWTLPISLSLFKRCRTVTLVGAFLPG